MNKNIQPTPTQDDEIDLLELAKTLWSGRRTIIKTTIIFACIGLFIAMFTPKEYTAKTIMVPQTSGSKLGGSLGGLAAMAGINLGGGAGGEVIPPSLYPKIVNSIPFKLELLQTKLNFEGIDQQVTYQDYYENHYKIGLLGGIKKYTVGLPGVIIGAIKVEDTKDTKSTNTDDGILRITKNQDELFKQLTEQINLSFNDKDGYIELSVKMPEALAAAQLTKKAQLLLQNTVTRFKIEKAENQLEFIEDRFVEVEKDFKEKQSALASFQDKNLNLITSRSLSRLSKLQVEYNLSFGVYSELAKQVETQKIQVKEDTPVFTIVELVSVPNLKSKPKRFLILAVFMFLGGFIGIGVVFGKGFIKDIKQRI